MIRIQATVRCGACNERSALNAALPSIACVGCGAVVELPEQVWAAVLGEVAERGSALEEAATSSVAWSEPGGEVRLQLARVPPTCPHCDERWPSVGRPFSCPGCEEDISVRPPPAEVPGVRHVVGEDRALLAGRRAAPLETLSCPGCAAPLTADGSVRKLRCGACDAETVLPDEIWRRLHAPRQVATWYLALAGSGADGVLTGHLHVSELGVDAAGRLLISGNYEDTWALLCVEADPVRLVWMTDLGALRGETMYQASPLPDGRIAVYSQENDTVDLLDGDTGLPVGAFSIGKEPRDLVADADGTLLVVTHGDLQLARFDPSGAARPVWPPPGCLGSVYAFFMAGGAVDSSGHRMLACYGGRWGRGHDGFLRRAGLLELGRFDRDGWLTWSIVPDGDGSLDIAPCAAADGTTFVARYQTRGDSMDGIIVRVAPDGSSSTVVARSEGMPYAGLAVTPDGRIWVATATGGLSLLDRDGHLLWRRVEP